MINISKQHAKTIHAIKNMSNDGKMRRKLVRTNSWTRIYRDASRRDSKPVRNINQPPGRRPASTNLPLSQSDLSPSGQVRGQILPPLAGQSVLSSSPSLMQRVGLRLLRDTGRHARESGCRADAEGMSSAVAIHRTACKRESGCRADAEGRSSAVVRHRTACESQGIQRVCLRL